MNKNKIQEEEIKDYDVYNALNLICDELGKSYLKTGFNPFNDGFKLSQTHVEEILTNNKNKATITLPNFVYELNNNELIRKLNVSQENVSLMLTELETAFKKYGKLETYLKMRTELIRIIIQKLKRKNANAVRYFMMLFSLDKTLEEILSETYEENCKKQAIINSIIGLFEARSLIQKTTKEQIEEHRKNIKTNIKHKIQDTNKELKKETKKVVHTKVSKKKELQEVLENKITFTKDKKNKEKSREF